MSDLSITGAELQAAAGELMRAAGAFSAASNVSTGAGYGSSMVDSTISEFAAALFGACNAVEQRLSLCAHWASTTGESFTALEAQVAASVNSRSAA